MPVLAGQRGNRTRPDSRRTRSPKAPITISGDDRVLDRCGRRDAYTLTDGGTTYTLEAGPKWFFGDDYPLKPYVGKSVTIEGEVAEGSTEVDVISVDGVALREPGKPPWAGGWKVVGEPSGLVAGEGRPVRRRSSATASRPASARTSRSQDGARRRRGARDRVGVRAPGDAPGRTQPSAPILAAMNVTVTPAPRSSLNVRVEVPPERLDSAIAEAVRHLSQRTKIHGFRPGKAPRAVVERVVGAEAVLEEAMDHLVQRAYRDALVEQRDPAARPRPT